jgi:DnaK suppressor protein
MKLQNKYRGFAMTSLTSQQIDMLQKRMRQELAALVEKTNTEMRPDKKLSYIDVATNVPDVGDKATAEILVDTDNAIIGRHLQHIRDLDLALGRIQEDVYGICLDCDSDISFERLNAYPTAKRCFACQNQREKTYASEAG